MASFDRQLAEFVRGVIQSANEADELPEPVVVERSYRPRREAKDMAVPVITVAHGLQQRRTSSRTAQAINHTIRVGIEALLSQSAGQVHLDRCDGLSDLTEDLLNLISHSAKSFRNASLFTIDTEPFYDPDAMDSPGIWRGVLTVTYNRHSK